MSFSTHYDIDTSFNGFSAENLERKGKEIYYDGLLVVNENGTKAIQAGSMVQGRKISNQQAISLWQHCYLYTRESLDPQQCARVYRNVNKICHTCYGDGVVTIWVKQKDSRKRVPVKVTCRDCEGTGKGNTYQKQEDLCLQDLYSQEQ